VDLLFQRRSRVKPRDPVLVEGLPGIGNIGLISVDYIIDHLEARPFAELYSRHFPPVAILDDDDQASLPSNELYVHRRRGGDLLFLRGDTQALTVEGQYAVARGIIDACRKLGVRRVVTVGGFYAAPGEMKGDPKVIVATSSPSLRATVAAGGMAGRVVFQADMGGGAILGANGLLLGFARLHGIEGLSLMVQTLQKDEYGFDLDASCLAIDALSRLLDIPSLPKDLSRDMVAISDEISDSALGPRHSIHSALAKAPTEDDFYVR